MKRPARSSSRRVSSDPYDASPFGDPLPSSSSERPSPFIEEVDDPPAEDNLSWLLNLSAELGLVINSLSASETKVREACSPATGNESRLPDEQVESSLRDCLRRMERMQNELNNHEEFSKLQSIERDRVVERCNELLRQGQDLQSQYDLVLAQLDQSRQDVNNFRERADVHAIRADHETRRAVHAEQELREIRQRDEALIDQLRIDGNAAMQRVGAVEQENGQLQQRLLHQSSEILSLREQLGHLKENQSAICANLKLYLLVQ